MLNRRQNRNRPKIPHVFVKRISAKPYNKTLGGNRFSQYGSGNIDVNWIVFISLNNENVKDNNTTVIYSYTARTWGDVQNADKVFLPILYTMKISLVLYFIRLTVGKHENT